jgi:hypothetical protein
MVPQLHNNFKKPSHSLNSHTRQCIPSYFQYFQVPVKIYVSVFQQQLCNNQWLTQWAFWVFKSPQNSEGTPKNCAKLFKKMLNLGRQHTKLFRKKNKIAASSTLHEAFYAAILLASSIGPAVAKATRRHCLPHFIDRVAARTCCAVNVLTSRISFLFS